ncbi:STT3 domain-containing protein [Thermococcus sp.]|uniref:STT3 domain-containing protein n=1 Tax=Thermococcus sp. TaxID=35749 RepID=UPI0026236C82|nr:STT3 domain-containing protein [Thermococcus sp.]
MRVLAYETASSICQKILAPKFTVPIIVAVASILRLLPIRFKYLLGYDPYFHLAYIRYAVEKGEWVNFFPYATGPWGFQIRLFHPLGLWMTPAYLHKFFSIFGLSLYNSFRITPVIFGVLTVAFAYLSILKLYGKRTAFLSGFFLAVSFGHVFRSMAGYYRGDNYMLFWYSVALFGTALALSKKNPRWRYRQLVLYLIPAFSTGLAAAFWQAYYPIFALVLANAILLGIGAFLIKRDRYIIDGLTLAGGTAIGALLANQIGATLGYGMVGYNRWIAKKLAEQLGIHFGTIKDVFLIFYLKYALPVALFALLALLIISKFVKEPKQRLAIIGAGTALFLWLGFTYFDRFLNAFLGLFSSNPILETQRMSFRAWWEAYGVTGLLFPLFFLRFRKPKIADFLLLGTLTVLLPMALIWTRFLFIASLGVALASGIGLVELYDLSDSLVRNIGKAKLKRAMSLILLLFVIGTPAVATYQGFKTSLSVKPFMNPYWENALKYLGNHSNVNDVVITWWDQGHWVTYYSMRAPVAQGEPSKWVAMYYLGLKKDSELMNLGVDYVIVSYDTVLKFGSVVETAGAPEDYVLIPLYGRESYGSMLVFSNGPYSLMAVPGKIWNVKVNIAGRVLSPERAFVERGKVISEVQLSSQGVPGLYAYINLNYGYAVIMNPKAFRTPLARLMFTDEYPKNYRLVYSDGGIVKIFRFIHPNVVVEQGNGSIVLRFENDTGTSLGILGFLDNGTLVYKKWFNVKGKDEFILPENLNGSVVVRYTYTKKGLVLDRGIFRIDDVLGTG